jgi:hypothetical protein
LPGGHTSLAWLLKEVSWMRVVVLICEKYFERLKMCRKQILGLFYIVLITLGLLFSSANATMVQKLSEEDLVDQAQAIFLGRCIYTYITISPQTTLKGDIAPQEITIRQLGGEVGGIGMHVEGASIFEEGEEALLFLKTGRKGFHRVLGLNQGKFSIETDEASGRRILVHKKVKFTRRGDGRIEKKILTLGSDRKLFLDDFLNRIESILQRPRHLERQ